MTHTGLNRTDLPSPRWEARSLGWGSGLADPTEGPSLACPRSWGSCHRGSESLVPTEHLLVRILCLKLPFLRTAATLAQGPVPARCHLNSHLSRRWFLIRSHSEVLGVRTPTYVAGESRFSPRQASVTVPGLRGPAGTCGGLGSQPQGLPAPGPRSPAMFQQHDRHGGQGDPSTLWKVSLTAFKTDTDNKFDLECKCVRTTGPLRVQPTRRFGTVARARQLHT